MADAAFDNLGRKIDATNMSIGELKGLLASLMKGKVGPAKPLGGNKDDSNKKLTNLFEKYVKDFKEEVKEQKKLLEKIADGIKEMKSKKSGGKAPSTSGKSFSDKAVDSLKKGKASKEDQTTARSISSLERTFTKKGSGYTHDVYCERFLKEIYGVLVDIAKTKGITRMDSAGVEKKIIEAAREKEKTDSVDVRTDAGRPKRSSGGEYERDFDYDIDIHSLRDALKYTKALFGIGGESLANMKEEELIRNSSLDTLEYIYDYERDSVRQRREDLKLQDKRNKSQDKFLESLEKGVKTFEKTIFNLETFDSVFKGVVKEERQFTQDIRQTAYETAGVTKESKSLQKSFEAIGKTVRTTGFDRSEFQKQYISNLKSGIKDQKKAMALTTNQLNTEKQIGVEAGSLGDSFVKMNNQLKFTNDQTAEVGRGIRQVGRDTGLVGRELAEVVSSSQQFVDQMRRAGEASASSVKNVIGLQAEFKKLGITDTANKLLSAISSTTGFYEANIETQSLLANAASKVGLTFDMTTGNIVKSNEKLKQLNKGLVQTANNFGLGGRNVEEMRKSFESLSDEAKRAINLRFKGAFGMEAGEVLGTIEAFENKTKTLSEKLAELNREKSKNLTLEEKATLAEKERSLKISASLGALTALSEAAKDVTNMDQALAKFGKRRLEFEGDIKALGGAWSSETDAARTAIQSSVDSLNEGLKGAGKKGLSIDSRRIEKALKDPSTLRELTAEITRAEQELATAQKAQADPLTSIDQTLKEINDSIRNMSQGIISSIFNSPLGRVLLGLTAVLGFLITSITTFSGLFTGLAGFIKNLQTFFTTKAPGETFAKAKDMLIGRAKQPETHIEDTVKAATSAQKEAKKVTEKNEDTMISLLREIRDCICSIGKVSDAVKKEVKNKPISADDIQALKEAGQKRKQEEEARGVDPAVARAIRKNEQKNVKTDTQLNKMRKKEILSGIKNNNKTSRMLKLEEQSKINVPPAEDMGFDLNKLISSGKEMGKAALAVTILGLGAVALGSAIVFVAKGILDAFNLDMNTIIEVAGAVAALAAAGGAIVGAGYIAYEKMHEDKNVEEGQRVAKKLNIDLLKQIGVVSLLGPTLVLLGAAIVKVTQLITKAFGLDMGTVAEIAGTVVAIVAAAGGMCVGVAEALEGIESINKSSLGKKLLKRPAYFAGLMVRASTALFILVPALVILSAALLNFTKMFANLFGLDMATAASIAGDVGAIIASAGVISGAVLGSALALKALGYFAKSGLGNKSKTIMMKGAVALISLAIPITLLAVGLNLITRAILGTFGIDAGVAAKAAWNVGVLIASTGAIAFAVMAAMAGLAGLGAVVSFLTGPQAGFAIGFMILGAGALMLLTPAVIALASALMFLVKGAMWTLGVDGDKAVEIAQQVGDLLGSASTIVLSVLASMAGLAILGGSIGLLGVASAFMLLGAGALMLLTPAVVGLATAIIGMASAVLKRVVDPQEAKQIAEALSAVLGAASSIALSILGTMSGLMLLAPLLPVLPVIRVLMWMGATAFNRISEPVVGFVNSIKDLYNAISFVNPRDAVVMGEETAAIFKSVGDITNSILKAKDGLVSLAGADMGWFGSWVPTMEEGAKSIENLMAPVENFIRSIKDFYGRVSQIVDPKKAGEMGNGIAKILCSVGSVVNGILGVKKGLIGLQGVSGGWLSSLFGSDAATQMNEGAADLEKLYDPVAKFISSVRSFYIRISSIIDPKQAAEMGSGVAQILGAVAAVVNGILNVRGNLINLQDVASGGWFSWFSGDIVDQMYDGSAALGKLHKPVKDFIKSTYNFYLQVAQEVSPEQAKEAGVGVGNILGAVGFVTSKLISAQEALVALSKLGGWRGVGSIVAQMSQGKEALNQIMWPVVDYALTIQSFSTVLNSVFGSTKELVDSANGVANTLRAISFITWNIMASAKDLASIKASKLAAAFSNSLKIVNEGIISPINKNLASTGELEEALAKLDLLSMIVNKMQDISEACKGLNPIQLGAPIEGKLMSGGGGIGGRADQAIEKRNEGKQAESLYDSSRLIAEFVETSLRGKGVLVRPVAQEENKAAVSTVSPMGGGLNNNLQTRIQKERASNTPKKSEITSPELQEIASRTEQQNAILLQMKNLLEKFVDLAKPGSEVSSAGGADIDAPLNNSVVGKPTNYYRRVVGNFNNTPGRAVVNVGAKSIS